MTELETSRPSGSDGNDEKDKEVKKKADISVKMLVDLGWVAVGLAGYGLYLLGSK